MKIDPRSLHQEKKLKIAQLRAIASFFDGTLSLSLGRKARKKGMAVFRGEIELIVPDEKEKEAKKQLHAFGIKLLHKETVNTWLKPATIARFKAPNGGKPIGKSHDGRWILCPSKRVLTEEQAFAPLLLDSSVWISQRDIAFPDKLGYTIFDKFPLSTVPQPLQPWCERIAAIFGIPDHGLRLAERLVEEDTLSEVNWNQGEAECKVLSRLKTCIETYPSNIPTKTVVDASGLDRNMFQALLVTALFTQEKIVVHSALRWEPHVLDRLRHRKHVVWIVPEIHERMRSYFDCEIYRLGNEYLLKQSINVGNDKAQIKERFTPLWELFPWNGS